MRAPLVVQGLGAMNDAMRSAAMAAAAAGYLHNATLPGYSGMPFGGAPSMAARFSGLLTNSAPPANMESMAANFAASDFAHNGYSAQRAAAAAVQQQEHLQGPRANAARLGAALSSPKLPQGLTPNEYLAIARAIEGAPPPGAILLFLPPLSVRGILRFCMVAWPASGARDTRARLHARGGGGGAHASALRPWNLCGGFWSNASCVARRQQVVVRAACPAA